MDARDGRILRAVLRTTMKQQNNDYNKTAKEGENMEFNGVDVYKRQVYMSDKITSEQANITDIYYEDGVVYYSTVRFGDDVTAVSYTHLDVYKRQGRDANKGACTHPCRWKYSVVEEKRPGEYLPVYENERVT